MSETLRDIGELTLIARITRRLPAHSSIVIGAGDDCAVVRNHGTDEDWVLTSDPVIQGTHFTAADVGSGVGRKAVGRVLSDIAAMGAEPKWGLIDLVAPRSTQASDLDSVYDGALTLAAEHGFLVVGGDTAEGPVLEVHVFGVGFLPRGTAVPRSGARPGDLIFVTGELGGSRQGRHLHVTPRVSEGRWLRDWATAMIDVSDGLASDLRHISIASGAGCVVEVDNLPLSQCARNMPDNVSAVEHALHDGEDFELLFTLPKERESDFCAAWQRAFPLSCTRIGVMTDHPNLLQCIYPGGKTRSLEGSGYIHFGRLT